MKSFKKIFSFLTKNNNEKTLILELNKAKLFQRLSLFELDLISNLVHTRKYEVNELIFQKGDMGLGLFIIMKGSVKVSDTTLRESLYVKQYESFGEHALVQKTTVRTYTAKAAEVTELAVLLRPDLKDLMDTYPRVANKILLSLCETMSDELNQTKKKISELTSESETSQPKVKIAA